jgi:CDP-6-deoxy-D-xylo-4-hexulose-3-dehydrase
MISDRDAVLARVRALLEEGIPGAAEGTEADSIPLSAINYGTDEILEVLDSLLSGQVTMGRKVERFEGLWADYLGRKHAVMVNSGSSANLAALFALASPHRPDRIRPGDEVITTAIPWATTIAPITQAGAVPVFVDVDTDTYNIDVSQVEGAVTSRTRAIMPVHLLGNPVHMPDLLEIARRHRLLVIEDSCEAHGASIDGRKVGTYGEIATFSFFFSHHISTVEGGMVVTDDEDLADLVRSIRAHGWARDYRNPPPAVRDCSAFQAKWLFLNTGFNLRPTEISGAFGIHQVGKLDRIIAHRRETASYWNRALEPFSDTLVLPRERPGHRHVWFGYPLQVRPNAPFTRD